MFKHRFLPHVEVSVDYDNNKRYYSLKDGRRFPSVTSIIGERLDKSGIEEWKKRVGEEEAKKVLVQASNRGTSVHSLAEQYCLNNKDYMKGAMPFAIESFKPIKKVLDEHVNNIIGIEIPLYSELLNAAGRCDGIALYDDIPAIIDFKTSRKLKKAEYIEAYFLQVTAYSIMFESMYDIKIPRGVIIISVDGQPEAQVFIFNTKEWRETTIDLFNAKL